MSIFRSYFLKNNTIISDNLTNNSQNPVTEISYGTVNKQISRFIFDVDLSELQHRIDNGLINKNRIIKHVLHMTNTINYAQQYIGKKSYAESIERASGFDLDLFNINEEWNEGTGYDFVYDSTLIPNTTEQASNWKNRKINIPWNVEGIYFSGVTEIIGNQKIEKGCENILIDITDYINQRLVGSGSTYTGDSFGLGLKFVDEYENIETIFRQAVAFHAKNTNTWYEPYVETIIDDTIIDDRNYFYLNKDNDLYLYSNVGGLLHDTVINSVDIFDNDDNLINTLSGNSIVNVSKGIYKITLNINSDLYPDAVIFRDVWNLNVNGRNVTYSGEFYLISENEYYSFNQSNAINFDNYFFTFNGISEKEHLSAGSVRKIKLNVKEMYSNQNSFIPLDVEYRIFTCVGKKYEIDVIPFTKTNRINTGFEFNLDTSWLIPQDYYLQIRMKNGDYYENKQTLSFTITSNNLLGIS